MAKTKLTTAQIVARAEAKHGKRYLYNKTVYTGYGDKLTITCRVHGDFKQAPTNHVVIGQGCPECAFIKKRRSLRSNTSAFLRRVKKVHGNLYDYSKVIYKRAIDVVKIGCPVHGEFEQTANAHVSGHGCPDCSFKRLRPTSFNLYIMEFGNGYHKIATAANCEQRLYALRAETEATVRLICSYALKDAGEAHKLKRLIKMQLPKKAWEGDKWLGGRTEIRYTGKTDAEIKLFVETMMAKVERGEL